MPKRKATTTQSEPKAKRTEVTSSSSMTPLRRSTRRKSAAVTTGTDENTASAKTTTSENKEEDDEEEESEDIEKKATSAPKPRSKSQNKTQTAKAKVTKKPQAKKKDTVEVSESKVEEDNDKDPSPPSSSSSDKWYWLLKAEPESRFENGVDVRFSIDDLASRTEPEPWDGIRAYAARNNLRAMKKGELAFFYHSNCKTPGLVGTMEIVQEHSPDLSAHNPKAPYYDASSKPEDPKWSVVHVKFRSKFAQPIGLKELREMGKPGQPLENMQMLKQSRLSVSRVSPSEWKYLMDLVQSQGGEVSAPA